MEEFFVDILQVNGLTKTYGKGDTIVDALDNVSFNVKKGEFVAVMGASGSGKSTLLHLLGGVDRPTSGKVYIDGKDIYGLNESSLAIFRRRNIGIIYQFYNLIPTLTAEENIMLPRLLDNRNPDADKLHSILETIGLTNRAKHLPNELSGGQQQRVSVGRALINDPAIILADEPTGNLDSKSSREIIDLLKLSNKRYNQTLLVITHDEKIAMQASRVITIDDGKIIRDEEVR
jgi:putative ABC transport system ATP-binding protein